MKNYVVLENIKAKLIGVMKDVKFCQCIENIDPYWDYELRGM